MASLDKLAIRGIRSFDDKHISVIEFFNPVTVIVGHNGSGKTTIIECLKYATTGDQPPNTRGGAFIHDPKMANEKEVKAQVKLRFHAANGTRMLAVRNLSVSVKKTAALTMKTLESILALADGNVDKGGKRGVISTKCAEMDAEIPQLLGVSKAVLENVIFCHQEDSYWPLSEPSLLKKKFDDIFEATRYTKALNSIKDLRKERVSDLKADNARLEALSKDKENADKLKSRISDLNGTISSKELQYEQTKSKYDAIIKANRAFYEQATKFRELYNKVEALVDRRKQLQVDVDEAKLNCEEVVGTDEDLEARVNNFGDHINERKQQKRKEDAKKGDLSDELNLIRRQHSEMTQRHGHLSASAEAQKGRIEEREKLIRGISEKHNIKGYNATPLDGEKVMEFMSRLEAVKKKQATVSEKLQVESRTKTEEYTVKSNDLTANVEKHRAHKRTLRQRTTERQSQISDAERTLEDYHSAPADLRTLEDDMKEKKARITKITSEINQAMYDDKLGAKNSRIRDLEEKREELNGEFKALNGQADARAKLQHRREEIKKKGGEIKNTVDIANVKYRKMAGKDISVESIEEDVSRLLRDKERELADAENQRTALNSRFHEAEATLAASTSQLKTYKNQLQGLERTIANEEVDDDLEKAIEDAAGELSFRKTKAGKFTGSGKVFESLLKVGKEKNLCTACNRHLNAQEMAVFEKYLKEQMKLSSPEIIAINEEEAKEWEQELARLQNLRPVLADRNRLRDVDIPALEAKIKAQEATSAEASADAEQTDEVLSTLKQDVKEVQTLKQHSATVIRLQKELDSARQNATELEGTLARSGSTKTVDDVGKELEGISTEIASLNKDKANLTNERDRQNSLLRSFQSDLHKMELQERDLSNQVKQKASLEENIVDWRKDIVKYNAELKTTDEQLADAQAPFDALEADHKEIQNELGGRIMQANRELQDLNASFDQLQHCHKGVERFVRDRVEQQLEDCVEKVEQLRGDIERKNQEIEAVQAVIANIEKEIHESGSRVSNLRDNLRVRKLEKQIIETQANIDSYDMEEAARARRNFDEKYTLAKKEENDLNSEYSNLAGQVSSHKVQLKEWENDLKDYKDTHKKYTAQLVKVKMSDMANNDLEKYAKALDNAIMKYHGLKMEEVNDTMKYLWNKTYQGTDIDGIKIRSDAEGGASKRSYNYRVVMTKDQVEMDMRGRCSAGQKMLASIIIRLALSDSFGQNCGILALDEPTNALDSENIDALAESLVGIINERKSHSNFQLIIITHDETFLRKLGQNDVMEHYWRVSRDARQKSVIERQRFR